MTSNDILCKMFYPETVTDPESLNYGEPVSAGTRKFAAVPAAGDLIRFAGHWRRITKIVWTDQTEDGTAGSYTPEVHVSQGLV